MMKKQILIIYSKNPDEIFNRKAALGSYIYALGALLEENGYAVSINGNRFNEIRQNTSSSPATGSQKSVLKKIIPSFVKRVLKDLQLFRRTEKFLASLANTSADLVLEFYSYGSNAGYKLSIDKNSPLLVVYDAPVMDEYKLLQKAHPFFTRKIKRRERQTLSRASDIVVYSNAVKKYLKDRIHQDLRISIHQNIDFTRFDFIEKKQMDDTIHIGFIGSFLHWHRVDLLLQAFTKLRANGYRVFLYLLGVGEEYEMIKQQVSRNRYKETIIMPGFLDGSELFDYKKKLNIGVMPGSNWYGAPNKIFEYGAAHMAVIAPDTPTIKDLFEDKKEVYLFKQDSVEDLYNVLEQLCDQRRLITEISENLYHKIKTNYSKTNTFDFYNRLIKGAIQ